MCMRTMHSWPHAGDALCGLCVAQVDTLKSSKETAFRLLMTPTYVVARLIGNPTPTPNLNPSPSSLDVGIRGRSGHRQSECEAEGAL